MANPFEKRATEYLRDDAAFLSVITPEPLHTFFERHAKDGTLYDRLCTVIGTPGSGKTTIATLLQFRTVETLLNSSDIPEYKALQQALSRCGVIREGKAAILGCRLPLESEYREFWELPYKEDVKFGLLKSFLQSRAVISWMRNLQANSRYDLSQVEIVYREGTDAASETIGGVAASSVLDKAKEVERAIYEISAALIAPPESSLKNEAIAPYHPFDVIDYILVNLENGKTKKLKPLVMLDDAHTLHPAQLTAVGSWLARREMKIGRWLLMRLDAETPENILTEGFAKESGIVSEAEIKKSREITYIWLQGNDRRKHREAFRKMAKDMADKYLRLMPVFNRQGISRFADILSSDVKEISESKLEDLQKKVDRVQKKIGISSTRRKALESDVDEYFKGSSSTDNGRDVRMALLHIMMHRYAKRVPQESLFHGVLDEHDPDPSSPIKVKASLVDGAKIFLLHNYNRPYYCGIDTICDASSENAELFLQLAGRLVEAAETKIIKSPNSAAALIPSYQHKLLTERAHEMISGWSFPLYTEVRKLCTFIAGQCVTKSLEPNASLDGGANAFGIIQEEFDTISAKHPDLAKVLKFGIAYNAISIVPRYHTKHREWCLIELAGPLLIAHGLTTNKGGFLERCVQDLLEPLVRV